MAQDIDEILQQLKIEFVEAMSDRINELNSFILDLEQKKRPDPEALVQVQRSLHNTKGQAATFDLPLTGRVAHMLEDYILNAGSLGGGDVENIRSHIDAMDWLVETKEQELDRAKWLLQTLPVRTAVTISDQKKITVSVLLAMPTGLQRRLISQELLSCGFQVLRAYDSLECVATAIDLSPNVIVTNFDFQPFTGAELCRVCYAIDRLKSTPMLLVTSLDFADPKLKDLPETVSLLKKDKDYAKNIGAKLIDLGLLG